VREERRPVRKEQPPEERREAVTHETAAPGPLPQGAEDRVMGINPVLELLRSGGRPVDALYIDKDKGGKLFGELVTLARKKGIPVKVVPKAALDGMSGALRHQGAVAVVSPKGYEDPYGLVEGALAKGGLPLILILDGVEDPQNLGAIIRTAESAGVDGVIIPEHRAAHLSSAVARASAGALEHMPVGKASNIVGFIGYLKEKGFWILGLAGEAERDYTTFDMNAPLAVVLGGEGSGIRPLVRKSCDALVSMPMLGRVSSLNVSVAAGIMLYEIIRQRKIR
jgi:23S rRNA (guanosine2251-2'-O)-methyltransferase